VSSGAIIRVNRVAFGAYLNAVITSAFAALTGLHSRMLCIQTLIVLLLPPSPAYIMLDSDSYQIVHLPTRRLHLCGIGVCGHLELHLGDGCCWVESLGAGLGTLTVSAWNRRDRVMRAYVEDGVTSV
jgi:hypothetical protein